MSQIIGIVLIVLYILSVIALFGPCSGDATGDFQSLKGTLYVLYAMPLMLVACFLYAIYTGIFEIYQLIRR